MKSIHCGSIISVLVLFGCENIQNENVTEQFGRPELTITKQLSVVMTDLQQAEEIYLDKSVPSGSKYLLLDKDELSSGMDWLGYALIENITDRGTYSFATNYFLKDGKQPGLAIQLLNEPPAFSWSFEKGNNLGADIGKIIGGSVNFKDSYIYEFVISKIANFTVDRLAFDDVGFNTAIFGLYLASLDPKETPTQASYNSFKSSYGVARGGSLYEVIINEYKSTNIEGETDIAGLVKAKGGFYKKTRGGAKKTIFKLFYVNPGYVHDQVFVQAANFKALFTDVDRSRILEAVKCRTSDTPLDFALVAIRASLDPDGLKWKITKPGEMRDMVVLRADDPNQP